MRLVSGGELVVQTGNIRREPVGMAVHKPLNQIGLPQWRIGDPPQQRQIRGIADGTIQLRGHPIGHHLHPFGRGGIGRNIQ